MHIASYSDERVTFSDGTYLRYRHSPDCCERNYADFPTAIGASMLWREHVEFDAVDIRKAEEGFILDPGKPGYKVWVPCYSEQNGWYSDRVAIVYCDLDGTEIKSLGTKCEVVEERDPYEDEEDEDEDE